MLRALALIAALTCSSELAAAETIPVWRGPRVLHADTAWIGLAGHVRATTGANHQGGGMFVFGAGLGPGELEVGLDDRVIRCSSCAGQRQSNAAPIPAAAFKLGIARGPNGRRIAVAIGLRSAFHSMNRPGDSLLTGEALAVISAEWRSLRLHGGGSAWAARRGALRLTDSFAGVRPQAGLEWIPPDYPRTTILADLGSAPRYGPDRITVDWLAGWGVRYQALDWGSVELAVRHRQGDSLSDSTVLLRGNAALDP